jgi:hypothetical protein
MINFGVKFLGTSQSKLTGEAAAKKALSVKFGSSRKLTSCDLINERQCSVSLVLYATLLNPNSAGIAKLFYFLPLLCLK